MASVTIRNSPLGSSSVSIFVLPPGLAELRRRLEARSQDSAAVIDGRMARSRDEISHWAEYDYVLVNDDLDATEASLRTIVLAERPELPGILVVFETPLSGDVRRCLWAAGLGQPVDAGEHRHGQECAADPHPLPVAHVTPVPRPGNRCGGTGRLWLRPRGIPRWLFRPPSGPAARRD